MTVMGWLNSVKAGGGTAFDHPQKGCSSFEKKIQKFLIESVE